MSPTKDKAKETVVITYALKESRLSQGISQTDIAKEIGVSEKTYRNAENQMLISKDSAMKALEYFGLTEDEIHWSSQGKNHFAGDYDFYKGVARNSEVFSMVATPVRNQDVPSLLRKNFSNSHFEVLSRDLDLSVIEVLEDLEENLTLLPDTSADYVSAFVGKADNPVSLKDAVLMKRVENKIKENVDVISAAGTRFFHAKVELGAQWEAPDHDYPMPVDSEVDLIFIAENKNNFIAFNVHGTSPEVFDYVDSILHFDNCGLDFSKFTSAQNPNQPNEVFASNKVLAARQALKDPDVPF